MTRLDDHKAALDQVLELAVLINQDMTQSLAKDGLTRSRTQVLWTLWHRGPTTQRDLAEALGVSARTITGLVDGLAATGFVTREPHPTDRRATHVTLTAHGTGTMETMGRDHEEFAHLLFGKLSDRRFDDFVAGLTDILAGLRAYGLSPRVGEEAR